MQRLKKASFKEHSDPVMQAYMKENPSEEVYLNDVYQVAVRRGLKTKIGSVTHLSIKRLDKKAQMDWRHLQYIKNELVGEENEGCELFPAESRLVDGANQFHLWVFEDQSIRFPFGFNARLVTDVKIIGETQRKFHPQRIPHDLEENNQAMRDMYEKLSQNKKSD